MLIQPELLKHVSFLTASNVVKLLSIPTNVFNKYPGPVVQSIVSLTSSFRAELVKCFMTLLPNTLIFFVEKMREAFALQKLLTFFHQKVLAHLRY